MKKNGRARRRPPPRNRENGAFVGSCHVTLPSQVRDVHKFVRSEYLGTLAKVATDQGYAWDYALGTLPTSSDFSNLFDQYRIREVEITFSLTRTAATEPFPTMVVYPDYDSASAPSSIAVATQRRCTTYTFSTTNQTFTLKLRPRAALGTAGGADARMLVPRSAWLDMTNTNAPHNGLCAWIASYNTTDTPTTAIRYVETYHFECCGLH